jgi:Flp pilus assembly protein TadG
MKIMKLLKCQKGAALVVFAMGLPIIIGLSSLTIDVGHILTNKAQVSAAADAAALAGAQELPRFPADSEDRAITFLERNGVPFDERNVAISWGADNRTIKVAAARDVPLYFGPLFGVNSYRVAAAATAKVSIANSVPWIVPFVLPKTQSFDHTKTFTMRMYGAQNRYYTATAADPADQQMDYMNVGIENTSFDKYIYYLKYGYQKKFSVGNDMQYLGPSSGGQASVDAFYDRTVRDSNRDITKAKLGDPRVMLIPLVESMLPRTTREGTKMKIVGFVGFFLDEVHREYGERFWAKGRFIKDLNVGPGETTDDASADFGVRTVSLSE